MKTTRRTLPFVLAATPALLLGATLTGCETTGGVDSSESAEARTDRLADGDRVPMVTVRTASGEAVDLDQVVRQNGRTVLIFYRGGWCPYCNEQLNDWQANLGRLNSLGYNLIAVTPESPENAVETADDNGLGFTILSDADHEAAAAFGVDFTLDERTVERYRGYGIDLDDHNESGEWRLPHRGTYVIDEHGVIQRAWLLTDYTEHTPAAEVVNAIATMKW